MKRIENNYKYCIFEKKDFEEITVFILKEIENKLQPMKQIFASWKKENNHVDKLQYHQDISDPDF